MDDFFIQLAAFSKRIFGIVDIDETVSPWHGSEFASGRPKGAIIHYTAGTDHYKTAKWFMQKKYDSRVCAHAIVARQWPAYEHELAKYYPLVYKLPTMILQCVPPSVKAIHATWTNNECYGIELVNAGELRRQGKYWLCGDSQIYKLKAAPIKLYNRHWASYTSEQILGTISLLRYLRDYTNRKLDIDFIVGHENVQGLSTKYIHTEKRDPGPLFPIHGVRSAIRENIDPILYNWFTDFTNDFRYGEVWRDNIILESYAYLEPASRAIASPKEAWAQWKAYLTDDFIQKGTNAVILVKTILQLLGYTTSALSVDNYKVTDSKSIKIFQKLMGLTVDGIAGPNTRQILISRLIDRGFFDG